MKEDEIWNAAVDVWKDLPSSKIANAFVLAKRVADKIVATRGGNDFLSGVNGTIHSGIRPDFIDTDDGNMRRDGDHVPFVSSNQESLQPNPIELLNNIKLPCEETLDTEGCISI